MKPIQEMRDEFLEMLEAFKAGDNITDDQYSTLKRKFNEVVNTNEKKIYYTLQNRLNRMVAGNLLKEKPKTAEEKKIEHTEKIQKNREKKEEIKENKKSVISELKERLSTIPNQDNKTGNRLRRDNHNNKTSAINGAFTQIEITDVNFDFDIDANNIKRFNRRQFVDEILSELIEVLSSNNDKDFKLLVNILINIEFKRKRKIEDGDLMHQFEYFYITFRNETAERINNKQQATDWVLKIKNDLEIFIENARLKGSDWRFNKLAKIYLQFQKSKITNAGSYIETPKILSGKKAIINIKNECDKCILYALCAFKFQDKVKNDLNKVSSYKKYLSQIKVPEGITYPIDIQKDIPLFEKENNIKINILKYNDISTTYNQKNLMHIYNKKSVRVENPKDVCNLLLIEDTEKKHFAYISNLQKLIRNKGDHLRHPCPNCLSKSFVSDEKLMEHYKVCENNEAVNCVLPAEGSTISFGNDNHKMPFPFSVFADYESTLEDVETNYCFEKQRYQKHVANSVALKLVSKYDDLTKPIEKFNSKDPEEVVKFLVEKLEDYAKECFKMTKKHEKFNFDSLTKEQRDNHNFNNSCTECKCLYTEDNRKVAHHNHITGEFIATLCSKCNLKYKVKRFLPVYFHNLKGYDSHLIIKGLNDYGFKSTTEDNISCIPNTEEKYISFSKTIPIETYIDKKTGKPKNLTYEIRFIDTLAFLNSSLDSLVENLKSSKSIDDCRKVFKNVSSHYSDDNQFYHAISKGVYPYDYVNTYEKLHQTRLPSKKQFYSILNKSHISDEDYGRALTVWNKFNCKTLLDYHNIYLVSDVLLLADVFENFRNTSLETYKLDPAYYYTAPGLSWDAFLITKKEEYIKEGKGDFEIELLTDMDMLLMFEQSIRGGLSQISKRHAKANNKYMGENYKPDLIDEYIVYLDANALYGHAMMQYLPKNNFKWNTEEWNSEKIMNLDDKGDKGYEFKVDLLFPKDEKKRMELHDKFNGYAVAPENIIIEKDMLNTFQQQRFSSSKVTRLCTTLNDKIEYVVHYRVLKLYLSLGLELGTVHKVIEFNQEPYMKSYVLKNAKLRRVAKNEFQKDFFKLMPNSLFGKTLQNQRHHINFKLVNNEKTAVNIRSERIKFTIFSENLVGVHLKKNNVKLNKPIFIGSCILDDSKKHMFNFHYNFMLKNFKRENIDLLFTDTDSLCYHIKNQDPFQVMKANEDKFDLGNYNKKHFLYNSKNNKVMGKFKHDIVDNKTTQITEFVGLRAKLYAYKTDNNKEGKRCKGVKSSVVKKEIEFDNYKQILFNQQILKVEQSGFRTEKHQIYSEVMQKTALSGDDTKVYICDNQIDTLTHGHYMQKAIQKHKTLIKDVNNQFLEKI